MIKRYTKRKGEFTDSQIKVQKAFKEAAFIWKSLPEKMKASWKDSISGLAMTEFNMFLKKNAVAIAQGKPGMMTRAAGMDRITGLTAVPGTAGIITLNYNALTAPPLFSAVLQKITAEEASPLVIKYDVATTASSASIDGLESGAEYYVYVIVTDKVFTESTMMSESDGFRVKVV